MKRLDVELDWFSFVIGVRLTRYSFGSGEDAVPAGWELELCLPFITVFWEGGL